MDDLYSRILDQQVNNLIQSAEDKAEEVKEEVVVEQVEPVVEKKNIYARDESKLRDVVEYQPENVQEYFGIKPEKPKAKKVVEQKVRKPQTARDRLDEVSINEVSKAISFITKNDRHDEVTTITPDLILDEKVNTLQKQIYQISTSISSLKEATLVSGIGQGGDGQTPGSGVVFLRDLDDVDLGNLNDGDSLIWDSVSGNFVPGAGGGGSAGVSRIIPGHGIDIDPVGGIGNVEIILDANLNDLADVNGTPSQGDLLVYNGIFWSIGHINTSQLDLTNPTRLAGNISPYTRLTPGSYKTQEDANILFASEINDLIARVDEVQGGTKPGHYLGQLDCSEAVNEPSDDDKLDLDSGDYFIHTGPDGQLWGVGQNITDGNSIIWNGVDWEVVSSSNTLVSLGDTNINNAINGQFLVYDEAGERWENESVNIPLVTTGDAFPNLGSEKEGDIFYNEDTKELFVYTTVWEKVAGGGGGVTISADAPDPSIANEGDLWVETDQWTISVFDGYNWVGLTNNGLVAGKDPDTFVTGDELDATVDSLQFNITESTTSLQAAIVALDATHLRLTPQGPLTGPLTLSDDEITEDKQAATKEFVEAQDNLHLKLDAANDVTTSFRIKNNGKNLISTGEAGKLHLYHVADPSDPEHGANQKYVDDETAKKVSKTGSTMTGELKIDVPGGYTAFRLQQGGTNKLKLWNSGGEARLSVEPNTVFKLITRVNGSDSQTLKVYEDGELRIQNLKSPTDGKDAANRDYVDTKVSTSLTGYATETYVDDAVAAIPTPSGVPVGSIMIWMNSTAPAGWFKLQGGTFDVNQYPQLHAYLQNTAGYSSGRLPSWGGHYPGEYGDHMTNPLGTKVGARTGQPSAGAPRSSSSIPNGTTRTFNGVGNTNAYSAGASKVTINENWDSTTRPKTVVVHYIIKHD